jgi:hypothetical protein
MSVSNTTTLSFIHTYIPHFLLKLFSNQDLSWLIKAFENANHQKVEYTSDALENEQSLMINVDIDVNISESLKSKFLNEYK